MISKDKTYCTRGGQEVRIYATDAGSLFPVHGAIFQDGTWHGMKWTEEGKTHFTTTSCMVNTVDDLAEVKPRHKRMVWLNVYEADNTECVGSAYMTERNAHIAAAVTRIACIKVDLDFEEGEGL